MKYQATIKKETEVKFVEIEAAVRYDEEDMPNDAPMRKGDLWKALIDVDQKKIIDWPQGQALSFYMKVCDQGSYRLYDENRNMIASIENDYVPNNLLPGEYGDYLDLEIDEEGRIANWLSDANLTDFEERE